VTATARPPTETAALYDRIARSYQRWWAPVIEPASLRLLDLVAPVVEDLPEAVVLDIGAGTGPLVRSAVTRWPNVRAMAVDPSNGMLDLGRVIAADTLPPEARARLGWRSGTAERLPVEDASVDAVVSSFVLQYLPNRVATLREACRVLRPGGRVALVTWLTGDAAFVPWERFSELLRELRIERPPSPETGLFRSLPSAARLVRRAGFGQVHATGAVVEYQWTVGPLVRCTLGSEERQVMETLDTATRDRLERRFREELAHLSESDLHYRGPVAYVTGRRPHRDTEGPNAPRPARR
jgi:ubiquinone/menaquinone biosynthesis C-methylase UbiE